MTWTPRPNPFDGFGTPYRVLFSEDLELFVAGGPNCIATSPDGSTWTSQGSPFGFMIDCVWAAGLGLLVGVGGDNVVSGNTIATSADGGVTWDLHGRPGGNVLRTAIGWSESQGLLVAGGDQFPSYLNRQLIYSSDGSSWTLSSDQPFTSGRVTGVAYSPTLDLWVAVGYDGTFVTSIATSPDGDAWTVQPSGWDGTTNALSVTWTPNAGLFVASGFATLDFRVLLVSADGTSWDSVSSPLDDGNASGVFEEDSTLVAVGSNSDATIQIIGSLDGGTTWAADDDPAPFTGGQGVSGCYAASLDLDAILGVNA